MSDELTHLDETGAARMVDVGGKDPSDREAVAEAVVSMSDATRALVLDGALPKGDAVAVARVAAVMAAKRTSDLVPLCHPVDISAIEVVVSPVDGGIRFEVTVRTTGRTGVEMEAMTAASIGAVTLYDMVKGVERGVTIDTVRLLSKRGGRSGVWER